MDECAVGMLTCGSATSFAVHWMLEPARVAAQRPVGNVGAAWALSIPLSAAMAAAPVARMRALRNTRLKARRIAVPVILLRCDMKTPSALSVISLGIQRGSAGRANNVGTRSELFPGG